ncbi:MAG TPA: VOC family protein [Miltoncostaeaceae bacterium]|nr:VOC family protein [Miltoncostaeaceae bacterium]
MSDANPHLPDATTLGPVRLRVGDLDRMAAFYDRAIGLRRLGSTGSEVRLGTGDGTVLVELEGDPSAPARPGRSTGLFHQAILVPSRADLGVALRRVIDAGWQFTGAADHLVSEALYLDDPEGNGIEIYRDRPRDEWGRDASGALEMATLPLDVEGVIASASEGTPDEGMPDGTVMGHVHLQVADVPAAERHYAGGLGFDVTVRGYPGALFVAAGGYHHHLGLNTWGTRGAPPPPPGARGLVRYRVVVPTAGDLRAVADRLDAAGIAADRRDDGLEVVDPSGNRALLEAPHD